MAVFDTPDHLKLAPVIPYFKTIINWGPPAVLRNFEELLEKLQKSVKHVTKKQIYLEYTCRR